MRCPIETHESAEVLLAYCGRKLDADAAISFERHMELCPACREMAEGQQVVWKALDAWEAMPVSPDFNRRLYARIEQEVGWWDRLIRPFRPMLVRQGLPIAAAACLLVMAGVLLERPDLIQSNNAVQVEAVQADQVESQLEDMELLHNFNHTVRADTQTNM